MFHDTPEFKEIHPTKNNIDDVIKLKKGSGKKVWFICNEECGNHEWLAIVANRAIKKYGCPFCCNQKICPCKNKCNSFGYLYPEISKQWHPDNILAPYEYTPGSSKKVLWKCNKGCGNHEWLTSISDRTKKHGAGCPICVNQKICGCNNKCNSLGFLKPSLIKEWDPTNNKTIYDYSVNSNVKIKWKCNNSSCKCIHKWTATINKRTRTNSTGCPYCAINSNKICPCLSKCNSFGFLCPELVDQWSDKNSKNPYNYRQNSTNIIIWKCYRKCGNHEWKISIKNRAGNKKSGCPYCAGQKICPCKNKCNSFGYLHPNLTKEWHSDKNEKSPFEYTLYSGKLIYWQCLKYKDHMWKTSICSRTRKNKTGCPQCASSKGEKLVSKILDKLDIVYQTEKTFPQCKHINLLRFDFYLPNFNICIEYDGRQHTQPVDHFGGQKGFEKTQRRDKIKNDYCKQNNIHLLRVSYDQTTEQIELAIDQFINNQTFGLNNLYIE